MGNDDDIHVASAVLSKRYEEQLFSQGTGHNKGFLGAGKTTLLLHLLASGRQLKLGVLVNEVAAIDVDSQLLNAHQGNAAAGIKAAQLAGGCACCAVSSDLQAALSELAGSSNYQALDYLLLETSGVADAEPLAASLAAAGFKLTAVVAVLDSEAGAAVLAQEVAVAQLRAADVVVLNKCDLASLSAVAAVEDRVQQLAPGVRMLRARYGQVPPEALFDIELPDEAEQQQQQPASAGVQGEVAFLSHEPIVSTARLKPRLHTGGPAVSRRAKAAAAGTGTNSSKHTHSDAHSHCHHSSFGSVAFTSDTPLCMACFQAFAATELLTATDLFRAKGFVWFQQRRGQRYVFQLSGKQRAECGSEGAWQGPPGVQLVLIGQQQELLQQLHHGLQSCVAANCSCSRPGHEAAAATVAANPQAVQQQGSNGVLQQAAAATHLQPGTPLNAAAARFADLVQQHHRFELVQPTQQQQQEQQQQQMQKQQQQPPGTAAAGLGVTPSGLVQFSAIVSALHGVVADEVNAAVLRKVNATPGMFMCHMRSPAALQAASGLQASYQGVSCLQVCFPDSSGPAQAEGVWQQLEDTLTPVLRKAYQHVHSCKCDVASALQLMAR